jgi:hypothetical protein
VLSARVVPTNCKEDKLGQPRPFCTGVCEEKSQLGGSRQSDRTWGAEAEKSPLLEAVTRERLVKIQETRKDFACAAMICKLWKLATAL